MFKNKVVIVTGASAGIGAATAILFAKEGASVALVGRSEEKLKDVSSQCEQHGGKALIIKADISKDEEAKTIVEKTVAEFGKIDVLVNNAAVLKTSGVTAENVLKVFDELVKTNLRAVLHLTMMAAPHLIKSKGNIVNVSSTTSTVFKSIYPGLVPYGVSKAGLDQYTRGAAIELAEFGIRVNNVTPGPVLTDMLSDFSSLNAEEQTSSISKMTLLSRACQSEEIGDMILYLASDKAKGVTGSSFVIDNGYVLK